MFTINYKYLFLLSFWVENLCESVSNWILDFVRARKDDGDICGVMAFRLPMQETWVPMQICYPFVYFYELDALPKDYTIRLAPPSYLSCFYPLPIYILIATSRNEPKLNLLGLGTYS